MSNVLRPTPSPTAARIRTPLARARGLGSAKSGTEHFWLQRMTAVANIVLVVIVGVCFVVRLVHGRWATDDGLFDGPSVLAVDTVEAEGDVVDLPLKLGQLPLRVDLAGLPRRDPLGQRTAGHLKQGGKVEDVAGLVGCVKGAFHSDGGAGKPA